MSDSLRTAIAIGNFDGLHLGHQLIFRRLALLADSRELKTLILTFRPNPKIFFGRDLPLIFTDEQKNEALQKQNSGDFLFLPFAEIADFTAADFLRRVLIRKFCMNTLVVGENFRFGSGRVGGIDFLTRSASSSGFKLEVVPPLRIDEERVSSSRIRDMLKNGNVSDAARLLGRDYYIDGRVVEGARRGRELGFPTINLETENQLLPRGVFSTCVEWNQRLFPSVTNIGYSPTFSREFKQVETHILGFDRQIYHQRVRIHFRRKLREEFRFKDGEELVKQIRRDILDAHVDIN